MRGSVRKRGAIYTWYLDQYDASGRRRQFTKGGFRTKREAQAALNEALTRCAPAVRGAVAPHGRQLP
jgi:hypothetical protein